MSRLLVAVFAVSATAAWAQQVKDTEIAAQIEKARRMVAADPEGCVKYPQSDEIVVCGDNPDNKSQRISSDRGTTDENRLWPGEAVSTVRAACFSPIPKLPPFWTSSFATVSQPAIPLKEVLKGLPEPDMVVQEGSGRK